MSENKRHTPTGSRQSHGLTEFDVGTTVSTKGSAILHESSRIGLNASALLLSRFLGLALGLIQSGLIFRALGVDGTGQFGFALGYASLFTVFATLGIHRLLMRDISRDPNLAGAYLWTAELVVGVLSLLVFAMVVASTLLIDQGPQVRLAIAMAA
ncbi:Polysaccharide biosynthesis protein, partial [sediment metagenome]